MLPPWVDWRRRRSWRVDERPGARRTGLPRPVHGRPRLATFARAAGSCSSRRGSRRAARAPRGRRTGGVEMRKKIRFHISYANVTATLALVLAMSGGAYAALVPTRGGVVYGCYQ